MKKLLFLLLFLPVAAYCQEAVEVRLNNYGDQFDPALLAVFSDFQVDPLLKGEHPCHPGTVVLDCPLVFYPVADFIAALQDVAVVEHIVEGYYGVVSFLAYAKISTEGIGIPLSPGSPVTNHAALNAIFGQYDVCYYARAFPTSTNAELLKVYDVACDCDINALLSALNGLSSIIEYTENRGYAVLSSEDHSQKMMNIYPNPFTDMFFVAGAETVMEYSIFDLSGKTLGKSATIEQLQAMTPHLSSGMYVLQMKRNDGSMQTNRLIKK